ncbi:MAG TPA: isochorismatase family cysteine hydrolase [Streptosporangiaceae bacterium]|jgi:nicotinamidase-related amidase
MSATALLIMDVQTGITGQFAGDDGYLPRLATAARAARTAGIGVYYVRVAFRPGHPEIGEQNKTFAAAKAAHAYTDGAPATEIDPAVAPEAGDVIVTKKRVSAFAGSDLEMLLRAADVEHLVLTGIATSGVVLSTLRQAADLDYQLTVLSDGCLDRDPEVHRVLTEKVFPRQASVQTVAEWTAGLAG